MQRPYGNIGDSRRYTGPTAHELAALIPGSSRPDSQGRWRLRGMCHGHGDRGDSASLVLQDRPEGGLIVKCWAGCDRKTIIAALEQATGRNIWGAWEGWYGSPLDTRSRAPIILSVETKKTLDMLQVARRTWAQQTRPIPLDPSHPARLWLARRSLWRPELPMPQVVRWLSAEDHYQGRGSHTGAGSLVALVAPPIAWGAAWPHLPLPQAVQIIAVDHNGEPALDRPAEVGGLGKRSIGSTDGAVTVIGCPDLSLALGPVRVAEGLADALALASRYPGPAVATLGTATMAGDALAQWLTHAPTEVMIHSDNDAGGQAAARQFRRNIQGTGGNARALVPGIGKDAAEAAATVPFTPLHKGWVEYAATLSQTTDWPRWEIARQAITLLDEEGEDE